MRPLVLAVADTRALANPTPITIPAMGPAAPYPSSVVVNGMRGPITDVN